jgi:hypothetical protein
MCADSPLSKQSYLRLDPFDMPFDQLDAERFDFSDDMIRQQPRGKSRWRKAKDDNPNINTRTETTPNSSRGTSEKISKRSSTSHASYAESPPESTRCSSNTSKASLSPTDTFSQRNRMS